MRHSLLDSGALHFAGGFHNALRLLLRQLLLLRNLDIQSGHQAADGADCRPVLIHDQLCRGAFHHHVPHDLAVDVVGQAFRFVYGIKHHLRALVRPQLFHDGGERFPGGILIRHAFVKRLRQNGGNHLSPRFHLLGNAGRGHPRDPGYVRGFLFPKTGRHRRRHHHHSQQNGQDLSHCFFLRGARFRALYKVLLYFTAIVLPAQYFFLPSFPFFWK